MPIKARRKPITFELWNVGELLQAIPLPEPFAAAEQVDAFKRMGNGGVMAMTPEGRITAAGPDDYLKVHQIGGTLSRPNGPWFSVITAADYAANYEEVKE